MPLSLSSGGSIVPYDLKKGASKRERERERERARHKHFTYEFFYTDRNYGMRERYCIFGLYGAAWLTDRLAG